MKYFEVKPSGSLARIIADPAGGFNGNHHRLVTKGALFAFEPLRRRSLRQVLRVINRWNDYGIQL